MKIIDNTIYVHHAIAEILCNHIMCGKSTTTAEIEEMEYDLIVYNVHEYGAKATLKELKSRVYKSESWVIENELSKKYGSISNGRHVYDWSISGGFDDLVKLKDVYHSMMNIAETAGRVYDQLSIIRKHSLFGAAYANAVQNLCRDGDFCFPDATEIFYEFGRLLYKITVAGGIIPDKYTKYIVWKKNQKTL